MALYDDPKKKRPLTALEQQAAATQADYGASVDRMQTAQKQATGIQIPMPIIQEGRGSFKSIARPGQDAAVTALRTLGGVARQEQDKQTAMIPTFQAQAAGLRAQAGADRAKAATLGANKLLANVGAAPIAAPLATPRPAVQPATAAIASPGVRFAGIDAAPDNFYRNPPGTKPRTAAELNQASQAEVAARTSTQSPASPPTGAGAPSAAGGAAPKPYTLRPDGVAVVKVSNGSNAYGATGASVANAQGRIGSVNTQNFGNPVVPQGPGAIARPGIASTFGLSVNDPRIDDQRAIARPQLGPNQLAGGGTLRGPDAMAEAYNSREDREARNKVLGDIDTALFLARGKPGSEQVMADLLQTKARVAGGAEQLSAEALQGRANRNNVLANTGMEQAGQTQRQQMAGDVTREGNQLGFQSDIYKTSADIARPDIKQDAAGNYVNLAGGVARPVLDANGKPVQGQQTAQATQRDYAREADDKLLTELIDMQADATGAIPKGAIEIAQQQLQTIRGQQTQAPAGMKQVGTSGGKPVYEDAQGNRFTL